MEHKQWHIASVVGVIVLVIAIILWIMAHWNAILKAIQNDHGRALQTVAKRKKKLGRHSFDHDDLEADDDQAPVHQSPKSPAHTSTCLDDGKIRKTYSREQETCHAMGMLFGKPFTKVRPAWLRNPESGRRLEIDCYNAELKMGAEFNGIAHYTYPNPFHKSIDQFHAQQRRDQYKLETCQQEGVRLFVVPDTVKKGQILQFLKTQIIDPAE